MAYSVAHLGVKKACFLHFLVTIQAAPLVPFEESCQKLLFVVKALSIIFFGVSLLLFSRNLRNSRKVMENTRKTAENRAIYCGVRFYLPKPLFWPKGKDLPIEKCRKCHFITF